MTSESIFKIVVCNNYGQLWYVLVEVSDVFIQFGVFLTDDQCLSLLAGVDDSNGIALHHVPSNSGYWHTLMPTASICSRGKEDKRLP